MIVTSMIAAAGGMNGSAMIGAGIAMIAAGGKPGGMVKSGGIASRICMTGVRRWYILRRHMIRGRFRC